ncbi:MULTISPECIES: hypothetical protein [Cyanophyceae]|uniref:Uncharacterized protein n=1 Tax=Leptolyngbya subtilissima DQ-A4 TaxID=2933933 RepID=A0ABV0K8I0_9CYAN|nr:hypothetical protein [Nodosilinea sp. FACHB-141]MBD2110698.1 hypothetical protein [Nodosilinea sp. FACHB-141]
MRLNLAKSPLVCSIGGVGAIAAVLIGMSYLPVASGPAPEPELTLNSPSVSPWQLGTDLGWQAAVAAQTAQTQADWQRVSDLWNQAIAALETVPATDANYAQAQAKAEEYRGNRAIAGDRLAKASPDGGTVASDLQKALTAAEPSFSFSSGPANRTVGQSADGLATVELTSDRATLVLARSEQGSALTMAQVVYANQFLSLAAPETAAQPWLLEGLRDVQRNQPPTLPADTPVTLSAAPDALTITVVAEP